MALSATGLHFAMYVVRVEDQEIVTLFSPGPAREAGGQDDTDQHRGDIFIGHALLPRNKLLFTQISVPPRGISSTVIKQV